MYRNVVPGFLVKEILDSTPKQYDLPLDTPVEYDLSDECLRELPCSFTKVEENTGKATKITYFVDHPAFTDVRNALAKAGYINKVTTYWNGDTVLKPFRLNSIWFQKGDTFPCAAALATKLKRNSMT